jgi:AAA15 family ATPase/GTPase
MFTRLDLENFGIFDCFEWNDHAKINILIGKNDTGKSQLLKILYSLAKSVEIYHKQSQPNALQESFSTVLANKLIWTFQPEGKGLGELITKGQNKLNVQARLCEENYHFSFGKDTTRKITDVNNHLIPPKNLSAIFVPPKEVLTAFEAIAATREQLEIFGFDDTYYDLITSLRLPTTKGNIQKDMKEVLENLVQLFEGEILREGKQFILKRGREKFWMSQVAEGVKKIGILTTLIRNRSLQKGTILFIDEPENNLHPEAIVALVKMLFSLSKADIQIYLATHSYFVIKQFELLARKHKETIQICSLIKEENNIIGKFRDLQQGLPDNPIIDASIQLYEDDVRLELEA